MPDLSNAEISVEGEHADCNTCGESFHWEQLTLAAGVYYCDDHAADTQSCTQCGCPLGDHDQDTMLCDAHPNCPGHTEPVRDYSDAIADLIGGLAEVWRMP